MLAEIRQLIVRMAAENPTWGYTRIQGAVQNVGHRVGRSTIARLLKAAGMPPVPERPTSWQTFLRAHWGAIAGADFFTTEVWTWRGLVTFYTVFVIDLASRRVQIVGSTPYPDEPFMQQVVRTLVAGEDGLLVPHHVLICDRDTKWSAPVRTRLGDAGIRVAQTPYQAPNANAYAERFVRSIKDECLSRVIPFGERHFRRTMAEYVEHYHHERNHQGIGNTLIEGAPAISLVGRIRRAGDSAAYSTITNELRERGGDVISSGSAERWEITDVHGSRSRSPWRSAFPSTRMWCGAFWLLGIDRARGRRARRGSRSSGTRRTACGVWICFAANRPRYGRTGCSS